MKKYILLPFFLFTAISPASAFTTEQCMQAIIVDERRAGEKIDPQHLRNWCSCKADWYQQSGEVKGGNCDHLHPSNFN
jgi:hypothetical protein